VVLRFLNIRQICQFLLPKRERCWSRTTSLASTTSTRIAPFPSSLSTPTKAITNYKLYRYFRTGLYPSPKPEILGREAEGTIVSTGPGELYSLKTGDRVVWLGPTAYAEYSCAPAAKTHAIPSSLKPGIAAAALLQGLTALTLIKEAYEVKKGDWVLVHAAAGGVGLLLVQMLKAVGAKTIGTASTAEKIELAKKNGADYMVNYKEEKDFVGKVKEITEGQGVNVVFDSTGKDQFENDLEVVARKGTVVSYGNSVSDVSRDGEG
jgi:NADPH2:quinone reductase